MPVLELSDKELIVRLNLWETIAALRSTIRIPLAHVRSVTTGTGFKHAAYGFRLPGTGIPGLIAAGTYLKNGERQFVFVTRGTHPIVIALTQEKWPRIILGVSDPQDAIQRINTAIATAPAPAPVS